MDQNLKKEATQAVSATIVNLPIGAIMPYAGIPENFAGLQKQGWLPCEGQAVDVNAYPELYAVIKNSWGTPGNGKFNVPDLRGMFLRGVSGASVVDPDKDSRERLQVGGNERNAVGSMQRDGFKSHSHKTDVYVPNAFTITNRDNQWNPPNAKTAVESSRVGGNETRPVNVYVFYLIFTGKLG